MLFNDHFNKFGGFGVFPKDAPFVDLQVSGVDSAEGRAKAIRNRINVESYKQFYIKAWYQVPLTTQTSFVIIVQVDKTGTPGIAPVTFVQGDKEVMKYLDLMFPVNSLPENQYATSVEVLSGKYPELDAKIFTLISEYSAFYGEGYGTPRFFTAFSGRFPTESDLKTKTVQDLLSQLDSCINVWKSGEASRTTTKAIKLTTLKALASFVKVMLDPSVPNMNIVELEKYIASLTQLKAKREALIESGRSSLLNICKALWDTDKLCSYPVRRQEWERGISLTGGTPPDPFGDKLRQMSYAQADQFIFDTYVAMYNQTQQIMIKRERDAAIEADLQAAHKKYWQPRGRWYPNSKEWNYCNSRFPYHGDLPWMDALNSDFCKCINIGDAWWPHPQNPGGLLVRGLNPNGVIKLATAAVAVLGLPMLDPTMASTGTILTGLVGNEVVQTEYGKEVLIALTDPTGGLVTGAAILNKSVGPGAAAVTCLFDPTGVCFATMGTVTLIDNKDKIIEKAKGVIDSITGGGGGGSPSGDQPPGGEGSGPAGEAPPPPPASGGSTGTLIALAAVAALFFMD